MRRTTLAIVLVAIATTAVAGLGAAQETATPSGGNASDIPDGERIDQRTVLIDSEYRAGPQEAAITLHSSSLQPITITDVSPYVDGGEMEQRSVTVPEGETTTIRVPVSPGDNGFVGVSVTTRTTLYAVPLQRPGISLAAPQQNDLMALVLGAFAPIGAGRAIEWYKSRRASTGVVRIDG